MSILHSYRWRKRIAFIAVAVGVAVPLIWLGVRYSDPGNPENANGPTVADYAVTKNVPFTAGQRHQVHKVLKQFISTAVVRHDVSRAWDIAGPTLKEGVTRKEWDKGALPVIPYPALDRGWGNWSFVQYSYTESKKHTVGLEVFLFPKPNSGWSAMTADVEVVHKPKGRWLVDYWMPKKFHGPPSLSAAAKAKAKKHAAKAQAAAKRSRQTARKTAAPLPPPAETGPPKPSNLWWAVPIALLAFIVLAPLGIGVVIWYRNRRAAREWAART